MIKSVQKLLILFLFIVSSGYAGVIFDSSTKTAHTGTSGSFNYDAAGTTSKALIFTISSAASNSALTGVSYAGATLSRLAVADGGAAAYVEMWGLLNPASGSNAFTFDFAGSVSRVVGVSSYDNVIGFGESLTNTIGSGSNMRLTGNASATNSLYVFSVSNSNSAAGWSTFPPTFIQRQTSAGLAPNWILGDAVTGTATANFTFVKAAGNGTNAGAAVEMQPLNSPTPTNSPTKTITLTPTPTPSFSLTFTFSPTRSPTITLTSTRSPTMTFSFSPTRSPTPTITRTQTPPWTTMIVTPQLNQTNVVLGAGPDVGPVSGNFNFGATSSYSGVTPSVSDIAHIIFSGSFNPGSNPFHWNFVGSNGQASGDQIFTYPTQTSTPTVTPTSTPSLAGIFITEVYLGTDTSGTTGNYNQDYVVLYNSTASPVSLGNSSLQWTNYATLPSNTHNNQLLSGTIPAHGFYLVTLSGSGTAGSPVPTPDQATSFGSQPLSPATDVVLVNTQGSIGLNCGSLASNQKDYINLSNSAGWAFNCGSHPSVIETSRIYNALNRTDICTNGFTAGEWSRKVPNPLNSFSSTFNCSVSTATSTPTQTPTTTPTPTSSPVPPIETRRRGHS